jgi:hypothetical protein
LALSSPCLLRLILTRAEARVNELIQPRSGGKAVAQGIFSPLRGSIPRSIDLTLGPVAPNIHAVSNSTTGEKK